MKRADHELVQEVLDGSVSTEAFAAFQQRMREEPEIVKLYGEYAMLHHTLSEEFEDHAPGEPTMPSDKWNAPARLFLLAALVLIVVIVAVSIHRKSTASPAPGPLVGENIGQFTAILEGPFQRADWRADYGNPEISMDRIDGENYSIFRRLVQPEPTAASPVICATLRVESPASGQFHTDGWAGMSFYSQGIERLFFGDCYGPERTWALDVKQRIPIILPGKPVIGPKTVTLRYDRRTGEVSLHEGKFALGPAFCRGKIPAGLTFDEIRIGASSSAALAVGSLVIRAGDGPP